MSAAQLTKAPITLPHGDRARAADHGEQLLQEEHADRSDIGAAFVHKRLWLQHQIRELRDAHEQGLALDMAIAAEQLEAAAVDLAVNVRSLLARKAHMDAQVQNALYECRALQESIADLFEACLRPEPPRPLAVWPNGRSPAESYPWLRAHLESYVVLIERTLTLHGKRGEEHMSDFDGDSERTSPGRAAPDIAFRQAMAGVMARCDHLTTLLDNRDFGQVEYTMHNAVNLWLTGRAACRRLVERKEAPRHVGDARQLLESSYMALLDLLKRAHTLIDKHETRNALDDLRITLVGAMTQPLSGG
jgi:hypothetical protein